MEEKLKVRIIELRKKGKTVNEIACEVDCAKSTVSYHINNFGLGGVRNVFIKDVSDDTISTIKKLRLESKTYSEIRSIVGIDEDKLIKVCNILELNKAPKNNKKDIDKEEILKYYKKVNSLRKTAEFFKCSREYITKRLPSEEIELNRVNKLTKEIKTKSQSVIDWRKRKKIELVEYKGGRCERCGYNKLTQVLQFHHLDPKEKDFTISGKSYSFERLKKEVDKCIMVCANCHIEIHEELKKKENVL